MIFLQRQEEKNERPQSAGRDMRGSGAQSCKQSGEKQRTEALEDKK